MTTTNKHRTTSRNNSLTFFAATLLWACGASAQSTGLVAAWSFDEGTGTSAADTSGNGNHGTLVNGVTWSSTAKFGKSASFDGTNDRIDVADANSLDLTSGMTLEAWVRPTANSSYRTVLLKEVSGELGYALYAADSDHGARPSGWVRISGNSRYADGTASLGLSSWTHIAVTYNGSALVFYVNGVATRTTATTGNAQTSTMPLRIGGNTIWGEYFQGQIDEVRVYNRALSASEIQIDMVTPITGTPAPDTTAPSVALSAPASGATVSGTTSVSADASDNVGVVGVQFVLDGANLGSEDTSAPYSISWATTASTNGTHTLTAVARDAAGNTTTSAARTVTVSNSAGDTTAPSVSVTAPSAGASVSGSVTLTASASDNVGVVGVQFRVDGVSTVTEDTSSPFSRTWDTTAASNGSHSITAVARDAAGNTTMSAAVTVTVANGDTTNPSVTFTSPSSGATVSGTVSVTASASDNVGIAGVQFQLDGANVGSEDTSSPYSISWATTGASNGSHTLTAVARDAAGNTASATRMVTVSNSAGDSAPPSISVTSPASGASVSGSVTLTASASDNVGVVGVQFRVDGVSTGSEDTSSPFSRTWDTTGASNGAHSVTAVARDAAGNTTTSAAATVTVANGDTTNPSVSFSSPASGATVSGTVTVSASASDNVGVVGVQFRLDGATLGSEDTSSPYSISWSTTGASNGSHTLTAVARDAAGRTATATRTVTVSNGGSGASLTIDGNTRYQTIDGFGISANSLSWNGGELRPAIDTLLDGGSTIWRVIIDMADWEATNDDSNPATFNWAYYDTIYSSAKFEELWATMAYLNQKGVTGQLMLNFMGRGPTWMGGADLPASMEDEWVETVASAAYYARYRRNLQFGIFAPNNEMDWDGIEGIRMDAWQNARVMRKLAQKLEAIGLGDLRLIGPDTASITVGVRDYLPALMGESAVMAKLDHFSFHDYAGDSGGADSAIRNSAYPSRNFWITEVSNIWDALTHMPQGPAAILVWDGYDSVYNHAILAGRGSNPPNDAGNGPALLAYSTSTRLYTARKAYYEFAQLYKFVPPGSVRVSAVESNGNVTLYAFQHPVSGLVTIVGRNSGGSGASFTGRLTNLPAVPSFQFYRTDNSANLTRGSDVTVTDGSFSFTAPGGSVFTLTYAGTADSVAPTVSVTAPQSGATVSGTVTVATSTASDNVGIRGVQFKLDGALLGIEDTTAPYSTQWSTSGVANGAHTLVAVARDWQGNVTTSEAVVVTVAN